MTDRLNPEALASMADAIWIHANDEYGICDADRQTTAYLVCQDMADKFIAAYLAALPAPRTITTVEELEALPFETIVLDAEDDHMKRVSNGEGGAYWERFGDTWTYPPEDVCLPARVLHVPTEGGGE